MIRVLKTPHPQPWSLIRTPNLDRVKWFCIEKIIDKLKVFWYRPVFHSYNWTNGNQQIKSNIAMLFFKFQHTCRITVLKARRWLNESCTKLVSAIVQCKWKWHVFFVFFILWQFFHVKSIILSTGNCLSLTVNKFYWIWMIFNLIRVLNTEVRYYLFYRRENINLVISLIWPC